MPFLKQSSQRRPSRHLFVSIEGIQQVVVAAAEAVQAVFAPFAGAGGCSDDGAVSLVVTPGPDPHGRLWTASFTRGPQGEAAAAAALAAVSGKPCAGLQGRVVTCKYAKWVSDEHSTQEERQLFEDAGEHQPPLQAPPVALTTEQANIPGLLILHDFVSAAEEAQLLAHIEQQPWQHLAKRRVQHYGYVFEYSQRGVDLKQQAGAIPPWSHDLVQRLQALPDVPQLDQLTVNEYTPGVGIAPHVDAHSSFTGAITALSLLGSCVMVFRKGYTASTNPDRIHLPHVQASLQQQQQRRQEHGQQQGVEQQQQQDQQVHVFLPPRTLVVMAGECRYGWQHYIPHRKSDLVNGQHIPRAERRVSLTFRQVRGFPCKCSYPECCDSQDGVLPLPRVAELQQQQQQQQPSGQCAQQERQQPPAACNGHAANTAPSNSSNSSDSSDSTSTATACEEARLTAAAAAAADHAALVEDVHVHQVYDAIASHFSSTRFAVWPKVRAFLESLQPGSVVADVGCGNGKYLGVRRDLAVLGCDRSAGLAAVAAHRLGTTTSSISSVPPAPPGADVLVCDALALAYRPSSCDAALCIAVLHHISSRQRRVELLAQLGAVLRPGGRALVTVWATLQEDPAKTIQRWHKIQEGSSSSSSQGVRQQQRQQQEGPDFLVPWHLPFHRAGGLQLQQQQAVGAGSAGGDGSSQSSSMAAARPAPAAAGTPGGGLRLDAAKGAVVLQRYYHLFEEGELEGLVREVPGLQVLDSFYDRSNWCVVFGRSKGAGAAEECV